MFKSNRRQLHIIFFSLILQKKKALLDCWFVFKTKKGITIMIFTNGNWTFLQEMIIKKDVRLYLMFNNNYGLWLINDLTSTWRESLSIWSLYCGNACTIFCRSLVDSSPSLYYKWEELEQCNHFFFYEFIVKENTLDYSWRY